MELELKLPPKHPGYLIPIRGNVNHRNYMYMLENYIAELIIYNDELKAYKESFTWPAPDYRHHGKDFISELRRVQHETYSL